MLYFTPKNISSATSSPSSEALITCYTIGDVVVGHYPASLTRQTNIGNGVINTASTATLVNDGAAANTQIIESTPAGQSSSAFAFDNMGNITLRTLDNNVWAVVLSIVQNASGAATKLFHGTTDNVPATGVTSGALGAGVTVAPNAIRAGAINVGATVTGAQVTTAVANATNATSAASVPATGVTAGALASGVTSPNYVAKAGDTMTSTLTITTPEAGGSAQMIAFAASDAATNWSINQETSSQALKIIDNTSGNVGLRLYASGALGMNGMGTNGIYGIYHFSGAATGTYTHGLSTTPAACSALQNVAGSTDTYGSDTFGSATIHINVNASPQAFTAIVVA